MDTFEIEPGTIAQVRMASNGRAVLIPDDASNVARDLREIDRSLRLRCAEDMSVFIVYQVTDDQGSEKLVTTAKHLDQRIVARAREVCRPEYDIVAELHKREDEEDRRHEHERSEVIGEMAEKLSFALRADLGRHEIDRTRKSRASLFVPEKG